MKAGVAFWNLNEGANPKAHHPRHLGARICEHPVVPENDVRRTVQPAPSGQGRGREARRERSHGAVVIKTDKLCNLVVQLASPMHRALFAVDGRRACDDDAPRRRLVRLRRIEKTMHGGGKLCWHGRLVSMDKGKKIRCSL